MGMIVRGSPCIATDISGPLNSLFPNWAPFLAPVPKKGDPFLAAQLNAVTSVFCSLGNDVSFPAHITMTGFDGGTYTWTRTEVLIDPMYPLDILRFFDPPGGFSTGTSGWIAFGDKATAPNVWTRQFSTGITGEGDDEAGLFQKIQSVWPFVTILGAIGARYQADPAQPGFSGEFLSEAAFAGVM